MATSLDPDLVRVHARARLPTHHGAFEIVAFETFLDGPSGLNSAGERIDDVALVAGGTDLAEPVDLRIHSECLSGDVFGSLRCDCRDQLEVAFSRIAARGQGVLLYLRQEGRGIGIAAKVAAYALQDRGLDTVEANEHLGFDGDPRSYGRAAALLVALGIREVVLHTNNPRKVSGLSEHGIVVVRREPLLVPERAENRRYLATKREKLGHEP